MFNVSVLTEGGGTMGFGHVSRCSALSQAFVERGNDVDLLVHAVSDLSTILTNTTYRTIDWLQHQAETFSSCSRSDLIVVDSYHASRDFYVALSGLGPALLCLDDFQRIEYPPAMIFNSAPGSRIDDYPHAQFEDCMFGPRFALLRREFWNVEVGEVSEKIDRVVIMLGGGALSDDTICALVDYVERKFPYALIHAVVGQVSAQILKKAQSRTTFGVGEAPQKVREICARADLAYSAAGLSALELAALGVPTIAFSVAPEQDQHLNSLQEAGIVLSSGSVIDPIWGDRLDAETNRLLGQRRRKEQQERARSQVDGKGALRAADFCMATLLKRGLQIRAATANDCQAVLDISNQPDVRLVSVNSEPIAYATHEKWFLTQLGRKDAVFLVSEIRGKVVGQLRFSIEEKVATVSISVLHAVRRGGVAREMMEKGLHYIRQSHPSIAVVHAFIKIENVQSAKFFERCGFTLKQEREEKGHRGFLYVFDLSG